MTELLAPAGNMESLTAALRCGADAIYIGGKNFSARQNASNFEYAEIKEAISLCHRYGAKLHIAVNTMLTDMQLEDFIAEIKKTAALSPDAFIVQDFGAAYIIKNIVPDIELHASTQMTIHTLKGAAFAKELGFSRVVISRESNQQMIRSIQNSGTETEIFVHGALCMSVSGQCYMSAMIGSRSANRGLCAQTCRLPFSPSGNPNEHALSLKDLSLVEHISKIKELGIDSLKIEGRMKRPEYVAAAVTAYRNALDGTEPDMEMLKAVFSRNGFTDGYFTGQRKNMFGMRDKDDVMSSAAVIPEIRQLYRKELKKSVLDFEVLIKKDIPVTLTISDSEGFECTVSGDVPQIAESKAATEEYVSRQLEKLGDTIYSIGKMNISIDAGLAVTASSLNKLRRDAIEQIYSLREKRDTVKINEDFSLNFSDSKFSQKPALRVRAENMECLAKSDISQIDRIILPMSFVLSKSSELVNIKDKIIIEPPRFTSDENKVISSLKSLKNQGFSELMCNNVCYLASGRELGFVLHGDFGLNIANSASVAVLNISDITLSFELKLTQLRKIKRTLPAGIIAYGKVPLMMTANCPVQNSSGCRKCKHIISDRTNRKFPVYCKGDYTEILNSDSIYLADKKEEFRGFDFITLYFTDENPSQIKKIINDYTSDILNPPHDITRGLYFRGIK